MKLLSLSLQSDPLDFVYKRMFFLAAIILVLLPFWLPLQDFLFNLIIHSGWDQPIQHYLVSSEVHGWQCYLLFFLTAFTGLAGKHTLLSKWEAGFLGMMGTYLFTMLSLMLGHVLSIDTAHPLGVAVDAYVTLFLSFLWLAVFWRFTHRFVLKKPSDPPSPVTPTGR